jgi:hypothetical protein
MPAGAIVEPDAAGRRSMLYSSVRYVSAKPREEARRIQKEVIFFAFFG